jgi:hypothetical protein
MGVVTEAGNQVGNHCCYLLVYRLAAPCVCAGHTMQVRLAPGAYTDAFGRQPAGLQGSVLTLAKQTAQVLLMAGDLCQSSLDRLCAGAKRARASTCFVCCGNHQAQLRAVGCTSADFDRFCP